MADVWQSQMCVFLGSSDRPPAVACLCGESMKCHSLSIDGVVQIISADIFGVSTVQKLVKIYN